MMITNDNDGAACNALDDVLLLRLFFDQAATAVMLCQGHNGVFLVTKQICCPFSGMCGTWIEVWRRPSGNWPRPNFRSMSPAVAAIETILGNIPYLGNKSEREPVGPKVCLQH